MRALAALVRRVTWPSVAAHPGRSLLTLAGIAIGVAVFLAVRLANVSITEAFATSLDLFAGSAQLTVARPGFPLDETLLPTVEADPDVLAAEPQVVATLVVVGPPQEILLLYGVDLVRSRPTTTTLDTGNDRQAVGEAAVAGDRPDEAPLITQDDAVLVTREFARGRGLGVGDGFDVLAGVRRVRLTVRGLLAQSAQSEGFLERTVAVMDLAAAQPLVDRLGQLDAIALTLREGADVERVRARLAAALPPGAVVDRPIERSGQVDQMLAAFRLNLTILSLVALLVGVLLVYNTLAFSVVARRKEIGVLRAIGVPRRGILGAFLAEGAAYGVVGGLLGVPAALLLARGTLEAMATTVSVLYLHAPVERLRVGGWDLLLGVAIGVAVSVAAAFAPARAAASVPPREPISLGASEADSGRAARRRAVRLAAFAGLALALAGVLVVPGPVWGLPLGGYAAAFATLAAAVLVSPLVVVVLGRAVRSIAGRAAGAPGLLAADHFVLALRRNAATVAALAVSLAMLVSVWIMVAAFRETVDVWVAQTVRADLVATPAARLAGAREASLPADLVPRLRALPAVAELDAFRAAEVRYEGRSIVFASGDLGLQAQRGRLVFLRGTPPDVLEQVRARRGALVSEAFARRFGRWPGAEVILDLPAGRRSYPIVGVFADYTTDRGLVVVDAEVYVADTGRREVQSVALYLSPGADVEAARRAVESAVGEGAPGAVAVVSNRELRRRVLDIFDQTFAITFALELIAVIVSVFAVVNTLVASILERQAELGILRAVGLSRREIGRVVRLEAGLIGAASSLLGGAVGVVLSLILVFVINRQAFGWTIRYALPAEALLTATGLAIASAVLAATWPARRAAAMPIAQAVRYE
jgi:putative ABC transport system permease protein